jgi:hypothetical protein
LEGYQKNIRGESIIYIWWQFWSYYCKICWNIDNIKISLLINFCNNKYFRKLKCRWSI